MQKTLHKFTTCLWFDSNAEDAMKFYASVFENAKIGTIAQYSEAGNEVHHRQKGSVMTVRLTLDDLELLGLNGGPVFTINPSISFYVSCSSEKEVDNLYDKLSEGGGSVLMELGKYPFSEKYAWINDKFGVSWQLNLTDKTKEKVSPCLMFTNEHQGKAENAIKFYTSLFKNSSVEYLVKYEEGELAPGMVKHASFKLDGQHFIAMDSPIEHQFGFSPATSFIVNCKNQAEIDEMWDKLIADGGAPSRCGWLTDKFGVSWQIVPTIMEELMAGD
ncbi:MAG: VOC family protein [Cyanobacteria bacterium]|nr:VOC family protein [Cyanobacteriota bacterium]